jgi:hypothetical protein
MTRPRVRLGLEASRATLNGTVCAQLGQLLAEARRARGLSVKDVAERLLLAPVQVTALEAVQPDAFYGADFYVTALRKYAALVDVDAALVSRALIRPEDRQAAVPAFKRGRRADAPSGLAIPNLPRPGSRALAVAAAVVVTMGAGWLVVSAVRGRTAATRNEMAADQTRAAMEAAAREPVVEPAAATPLAQMAAAVPEVEAAPVLPQPEPARVAPPKAVAVPTAPATSRAAARGAVGHVRVAKRTWIFVRYVDKKTVQRGIGPDEEFVLEDRPTYLAVGVADNTDVVIDGQSINNALFTTNGQLRVDAQQFARLSTQ